MVVKNNTKIALIAGEPGTAKSTTLIEKAIGEILRRRSVSIITPTHVSKENLLNKINTMLLTETNDLRIDALNKLLYKVHVLYGYNGEQSIFIDEAGMINVPHLFSILYNTLDVKGCHMYLYGDIKQLEAINASSIIEMLLRNNLKDNEEDVWEWSKRAYGNNTYDKLIAPKSWKIVKPVDFKVLTRNYRLQESGFTSYNEEYLQAVVDDAITPGISDIKYLIKAIDNYELIISPSHKRGAEVDEKLKSYYGSNWYQVAPFIKSKRGTKVCLNPMNKHYNTLSQVFSFVSQPVDINIDDYDYTAYIVTNVAQGATVDRVLYYMGDKPIESRAKSFYTRNNLYTAITRSRYMANVIGNKDDLNYMLDNVPISSQQRLGTVKSRQAVNQLFESLNAINYELSFDEIYQMYLDIFNDIQIDGKIAQDIASYEVVSDLYSRNQLKKEFGRYKPNVIGRFYVDYKGIIYDKYISETYSESAKGNQNAKGSHKSKVKTWLDSLDSKQYAKVKKDLGELSVRKFRAKYNNMAKKNVQNAIDSKEQV